MKTFVGFDFTQVMHELVMIYVYLLLLKASVMLLISLEMHIVCIVSWV